MALSWTSKLCSIDIAQSEENFSRLEKSTATDIDQLSTLLFVFTQTLINTRQHYAINRSRVQVSTDVTTHLECSTHIIRQLPLCWLSVVHRMLIKCQNVNPVLINFKQFLNTIVLNTNKCALEVFDLTVWKMIDEIMKICLQYVTVRALVSRASMYCRSLGGT
jgi:hypothetical protein